MNCINATQSISVVICIAFVLLKNYSWLLQEDIEHPWGEMDVSTKTTEAATRRLAVCNLDWDRVTATDLFGGQSCDIMTLHLQYTLHVYWVISNPVRNLAQLSLCRALICQVDMRWLGKRQCFLCPISRDSQMYNTGLNAVLHVQSATIVNLQI